jgi:hypothetical protein
MPLLAASGLNERQVGTSMTDILMLAFTIVFFAVALLYVAACEKLR